MRIFYTLIVLLGFSLLVSCNSNPPLNGVWYSTWKSESDKVENYMLDYLNADYTYRSKVLEIHKDKYYYEENEGYWQYKDNKLTITITKTNGKKMKPRLIPSLIRFENKDKIVFKLIGSQAVPEIIMIRTHKDQVLAIPKNKSRIIQTNPM